MTLIFALISLFIVAFGQPALIWPLGPVAALGGFALFWYALLKIPTFKQRFWMATGWFFAVQLIQLWWLTSHPYVYSYAVLILVAFGMGLQFGILGLFIKQPNIQKPFYALFLAGLWTLLEWSRLFFLSGHTWNPVGLEFASTLYGLQMASLWGVYGMTFWVILVNVLVLQLMLGGWNKRGVALCVVSIAAPYVFGFSQIAFHKEDYDKAPAQLTTLLVQPAFAIEEEIHFPQPREMVGYVFDEWKQILTILANHKDKPVDLIALPEFTVPFGTYTSVYPHEAVKQAFISTFGKDSLAYLPPPEYPLGKAYDTPNGKVWMVNNAYWVKALSNIFDAHLIVGLEDAEEISDGAIEYYSSALHVSPQRNDPFEAQRYEKRVLVPMGEYIPFSFCKDIAAWYGIKGSFTCGKSAKVMQCRGVPFGTTICYEETFGDMTRENRLLGAALLVNLTSDVWYPNSRLPRQHLEHARLRTVENGVPLIRSCNTGVTCIIDSLGRTTAELGVDSPNPEWVADALYAAIPSYTYWTLYTHTGDTPIVALSALFVLVGGWRVLRRKD